jgi:hypothetical protein
MARRPPRPGSQSARQFSLQPELGNIREIIQAVCNHGDHTGQHFPGLPRRASFGRNVLKKEEYPSWRN